MQSSDLFDPSLIIFGLLAIFVVWKLRSLLGVRVDRETPLPGPVSDVGPGFQRRGAPLPGAPEEPPEPVVPEEDRWRGLAEPGSAAWAGLDAIAAADSRFTAQGFAEGARKAYEVIVGAFAKGDRDTLRNLLSPEVFENFNSAVAAREAKGETQETAVVSIDAVTVDEAHADAGVVYVTLRFKSRLMRATRDKAGTVVVGGFDRPVDTIDLWTFARNPRSNDPNWRLVATDTGH